MGRKTQNMGNAYGPRFCPTGRAMLRCLVGLAASIAIAGCIQVEPPVTKEGKQAERLIGPLTAGTYKFCDEGRAVYVLDGDRLGGIAVVESAAECQEAR